MKWTKKQTEQLIQMYRNYVPFFIIAEQLGCTIEQAEGKIARESAKNNVKRLGIRYQWERGKYVIKDKFEPEQPIYITHDEGFEVKVYSPGCARGYWPQKTVR